ncbi:uncharacterized protein LOC119078377 [Bradysia coprophila]|uniref:uncharacterized protein LOC119078377 n=1 Tax=Bradysia coprophila TaxID=38358 RepID=UPI00187D95F7|nr:uncharacterized protein LOC119078377 [Bradysia coprophila]
MIKEFINILNVFEKATDVFQGSKYPTLNLTIIFYVEIKDSLERLSKEKSFSQIAQRAVAILLSRFDERFKLSDDMILASFLDPSMQHLPIIKEYFEKHGIDVITMLHEKWVKYDLTAGVGSSTVNQKSTGIKRKAPEPINDAKRIRLELIEKHCAVGATVGHSPIDCIRREENKYTSIIGVNILKVDVLQEGSDKKPGGNYFTKPSPERELNVHNDTTLYKPMKVNR